MSEKREISLARLFQFSFYTFKFRFRFRRALDDDSAGGAAETAQVAELAAAADAPSRDEPHAAAARARTPD